MTSPLLAFLIKLPLALAVFAVVAYAGTASRRIAGVLFTFPILNGIAIIASDQPVTVAGAIYPLVIFNCLLFAALLTFPRVLPPTGAMPPWGRLPLRIAVWTLAWLAGAYVITDLRSGSIGGGVLLAVSVLIAIAFMLTCWSSIAERDTAPSSRNHASRFVAFWSTPAALWRVVLFVLTFAVLFWTAYTATDQKWVGMASALPLPGLFALAALIENAETQGAPMSELRAIRDTLFLGPLLVIPFNWCFAHGLLMLGSEATLLRYALLFAMWAMAAAGVFFLVPLISAYLDRRSS
jgi:hypothetical protein